MHQDIAFKNIKDVTFFNVQNIKYVCTYNYYTYIYIILDVRTNILNILNFKKYIIFNIFKSNIMMRIARVQLYLKAAKGSYYCCSQ